MKAIEIIKNLSIASSYADNHIGITIYDYVRKTKPSRVVEFGTLHGYSAICIGLALRDNGFGTIECYDLWEEYEFNHTTMERTRENIEKYNLADIVKLKKGDVYSVCKKIDKFNLAHIDISNDGKRLDKILTLLARHINTGSDILFEGGSIERDKQSWISKNNKTPINDIKSKFDYYVLDSRWPSLSLISKNRIKYPELFSMEKFETNDGVMFPIYKNYESKIAGYEPGMVYATTIAPYKTKGPILHERRIGYMTAIKGAVDVECLVGDEIITYILKNGKGEQNILVIPQGIQNKIINRSHEEAIIVNLPDKPWYPFDEDTKKLKDWKWED